MKRIIALILGLILAFSLFSCEAGSGEDTDTGTPDTENPSDIGETVVMKVGDIEITFAEFNLQFSLIPNNMVQQAQYYYGEQYIANLVQQYQFDPTKPYKDQQCPESVYDGTFYDYFFESAKNYLKENAALCNYAVENGAVLTEEELKECADNAKNYADSAIQNFGSLTAAYGDALGLTTEDVLRKTIENEMLAKKGQEHFSENAALTQEDFDERYKADPNKFSVVSYLSYTIDGNNTTMTEDDVKTYADELAATTTPEDFAAYVDNFYNNVLNAGTGEKTEYTAETLLHKNISYSDEKESYKWMFDEASVGECYEEFGENGLSCTVFMLASEPHLNDYTSKTVRHILFSIDNYTSDVECKTAADSVYREYLNDPTEENFAALANKYSADPDVETDEAGNVTGQKEEKTSGGIYENIQRDQMVKEFEDWCFDESREPGDTGIVKTKYGYHIMYFVGDGERVNSGTDKIKNEIMRERFEEYMNGLDITVDEDFIGGALKN